MKYVFVIAATIVAILVLCYVVTTPSGSPVTVQPPSANPQPLVSSQPREPEPTFLTVESTSYHNGQKLIIYRDNKTGDRVMMIWDNSHGAITAVRLSPLPTEVERVKKD